MTNPATPRAAPPRSYADWCSWLDRLEGGACDEELRELAAGSSTDWTVAVAKLFAVRVHTTLNSRLNRIGLALEQRLGACRDEASVTLALVQARQQFRALGRFADIPQFPEALREGLRNLVEHHLTARQEALEKSARADRSGRVSLAVRRTPLNLPVSMPALAPAPAAGVASPYGDEPVRRIIIDQTG